MEEDLSGQRWLENHVVASVAHVEGDDSVTGRFAEQLSAVFVTICLAGNLLSRQKQLILFRTEREGVAEVGDPIGVQLWFLYLSSCCCSSLLQLETKLADNASRKTKQRKYREKNDDGIAIEISKKWLT